MLFFGIFEGSFDQSQLFPSKKKTSVSLSFYPTVGFFYLKSHFFTPICQKSHPKCLKDEGTGTCYLFYFNRKRLSRVILLVIEE
jgi:hypothetical protein